jgi:hypothetical protein
MRLSVRSTTLHTACATGHCRRTVAAARPEHVRFSRTAVSAQNTDTVSATPTVQLCASTVARFAVPLTAMFVSKYGTADDDDVPFEYTFFTWTVTTLETSCGAGNGSAEAFRDELPLKLTVPEPSSTVVTTNATVVEESPPVEILMVVELSGSAIDNVAAVALPVLFEGRTNDSATCATPSEYVVVETGLLVFSGTRCSALSNTFDRARSGFAIKVGADVGTRVGEGVGTGNGLCNGCDEGCDEGCAVGCVDGSLEGVEEGQREGVDEG